MSTAVPVLDREVDATKRRGLGCIEMMQKEKKIKLPLSAVQVRAKVAGCLAHVTVSETFQNPFSDHLEAVYIFPLSGGCAVSSFQMKVGERLIEGRVDERQAARKEYAEAMMQGKRAALLEQDRDDVFTVQVGNLPPGEEITVTLTYSEKLAYFDQGMTEIRLPLVVAPRYIPGEPLERLSVGEGVEMDTNIVPDASRITPPRLAPGVNANIALGLSVEICAGETIEDLSCSQHATRMGANKEGITISLSREDDLLDRDFVLRWRVATIEVQSDFLIFQKENKDCYGMISLMPPMGDDIVRPARDVIFVVDRSGSMQGLKMVSAARACSFLLATLGPSDSFAIQAFDDTQEWLTARDGTFFFDADEAGLDAGNKYLRTIDARGGTEIQGAIEQAIKVMDKRQRKSARMPIVVILTDGQVGNEAAVFKYIQGKLGDSRVFTVGIDTAVNDGFMRRLASLGGGTAAFVEPGAQLEAALSHVGREIGTPLITDLSIEDVNCGLDKQSIAPNNLSDLFEGRAVSAFFKLTAAKLKDLNTGKIKITGKYADGKDFETEVCARTTDVNALPQLWAKSFIVDLEDQYRVAGGKQQTEIKKQIVDVAVEHSLLTKFTAFVVVDHVEVVNKDGSTRKVVQPVEMPSKWEEQDSSANQDWGLAAQAFGQPQAPMMSGSWGSPPPAALGRMKSLGALPETVRRSLRADSSIDGSSQPGANSGWNAPAAPAPPPHVAGGGVWDAPAPQPPAAPLPEPPQQMPSGSPAPTPPPPGSDPGSVAESKKRKLFNLPIGSNAIDAIFKDHLGVSENKSAPISYPQNPTTKGQLRPYQAEQSGGSSAGLKELQEACRKFEATLQQALDSLDAGKLPDSDKLDAARSELLQALSLSPWASKVPQLQKYLRADLLQLLAALASATSVSQKLKDIGRQHRQKTEQILEEILQETPEEDKPFWGATV